MAKKRANQHIKICAAVGTHVAHGTAVPSSRPGFLGIDELHGAKLGGARHAAHRETRCNRIQPIAARPEVCRNRTHQMVNRFKRLQLQKPRNAYAFFLSYPTEVVANQINNHHILRLFLFCFAQGGGGGGIFCGITMPWSRSLDGLARHAAVLGHLQVALWGGTNYRMIAEPQQSSHSRLSSTLQRPVQGQQVGLTLRLGGGAKVDLINIAAKEVELQGLGPLKIVGCRPGECPWGLLHRPS